MKMRGVAVTILREFGLALRHCHAAEGSADPRLGRHGVLQSVSATITLETLSVINVTLVGTGIFVFVT